MSRSEFTKLMMAAARLPARKLPANNQLFRKRDLKALLTPADA